MRSIFKSIHSRSWLCLATALAALSVACSNDPPEGCLPGNVVACPCTPGKMGTQTCSSARTFATCVCGPEGDMASSDVDMAPPQDLSSARPYRYIFATRTLYNGNLKTAGGGTTGLDGADKLCQLAATAALLPGTYKAWISDSTASALSRMADGAPWYLPQDPSDPPGPYPVGPRVFNNKAALQIGPQRAINRDEYAKAATYFVWTGTSPTGSAASLHCQSWTTSSAVYSGLQGSSSQTDSGWQRG